MHVDKKYIIKAIKRIKKEGLISLDKLTLLKEKYNEKLKKANDAEEYFKSHSVKECMNHLKLFNLRTKEVSMAALEIENFTGRKMTTYEIINGFKL